MKLQLNTKLEIIIHSLTNPQISVVEGLHDLAMYFDESHINSNITLLHNEKETSYF